jgi:two-component system OmpR family sensor kinase
VSIRRTLLLALLGGLLVTGLLASGVTWLAVHREADRLFDYHLRQMALSLQDEVPQSADDFMAEEHDFSIQMWSPEGIALYVSGGAAALPEGPGGYETVSVQGQDWRVFTLRRPERTIQVAAPMRLRRDQATSMALRILVPVLVAIPLYGVLIWLIVGEGLRPLVAMAAAIRRRAPASLDPLPESRVPEELAPMTKELNALLGRLRVALETQRRFTADAAHELRSPLTALQMQLDLVERALTPEAAKDAIAGLRSAIRRAARLVDQLLTMARLDPDSAPEKFVALDLAAVAASVAAESEPLAEAKRVELRLAEMQQASIHAQPSALHALVRNLVDNALRYTPGGGRVTLTVRKTNGDAVLQVDDTGPGIPAEERERVLDRFYRVPGSSAEGSGLGLAIVREVARAHGAELALGEAEGGGLRVTVRFRPRSIPPAESPRPPA